MECPVCGEKINLSAEDMRVGEIYYDCGFCQSSLFFKEGNCQVLVEGSVPEAAPEGREFSGGEGPAGRKRRRRRG